MDNLSPEARRKNMQNIRSCDTKIEHLVRKELFKRGYRYRKNVKTIYGKPDIVLSKYKLAIFLDSCFWHSCPYHSNIPDSNRSYWIKKLERNKRRDIEVNKKLKKEGWKVLRFWEHSIKKDLLNVIKKIESSIISIAFIVL